jgi:CheY-like chemotaxis protein
VKISDYAPFDPTAELVKLVDDQANQIERMQAILGRAGIYDVTCARCGKVGLTIDMCVEEGDEWECPPCNARENARERADSGRLDF